jgi:hypothetical protein
VHLDRPIPVLDVRTGASAAGAAGFRAGAGGENKKTKDYCKSSLLPIAEPALSIGEGLR